ncbi:4-hydroxythreonine-4-phosphate dehydrogenase PdxA [Thiopseudomonas acetoxidans]|uniref:4-hydroxythreonine-4-phosphate dehydrogenase n=1 Tax=Thiopseudomonas acetoxidans TaxID=3041622 RepID=A0ABT7SNU8_9GAMM|nr:4-hydroxythreonine-4-phosphate dehydrogenase PdxA [Thiopseudomonas sp. CY1220]MDM7857865.1 4-hydroxythreonine-4-phosphate dehydrogenase PdxA [Thiopseudomonas sp. CY1220]NLC09307.1 4-hydroxythreonine-4-phosphate dehydrogenase PdxA [Gammaproteobacteria bacterium]
MMTLRFALTPGEPAGIGPDLCVFLAQEAQPYPVIVISDTELLKQRAQQLDLPLNIIEVNPDNLPELPSPEQSLYVWHTPLYEPAVAGQLNTANAPYVLETLTRAGQGCIDGLFSAMITAPAHKGVINQAGVPFSGHTEFLQELTHSPQVVMMLATHGLRVALVTTHLPLREVADAITTERIESVTRILHHDLSRKFGIKNPRIIVCGLNPHAGEDGHLGREELDIIAPTLERLRKEGMDLVGPLPADSVFTPNNLKQCDAVLAMYHDQGLPVLKHKGFGSAVNISLGMPIIRTSVDHGTALDLAGTGEIDTGSLQIALVTAYQIAAANV